MGEARTSGMLRTDLRLPLFTSTVSMTLSSPFIVTVPCRRVMPILRSLRTLDGKNPGKDVLELTHFFSLHRVSASNDRDI